MGTTTTWFEMLLGKDVLLYTKDCGVTKYLYFADSNLCCLLGNRICGDYLTETIDVFFGGGLNCHQERLSQCEQRTISLTQKNYDLSSEVRSYVSTVTSLR